jgi:hypothetical protein
MIETLKFVRGAVATKDLMPVLKHFHIYNGRIQGFNGLLVIDAPAEAFKDFDITVPAVEFLAGVDACKGEPVVTVEKNFVRLEKGGFKVKLPLDEHDKYPRTEITDDFTSIELNQFLLKPTLKKLRPFVSEYASQAWACTILIRDMYMYATNNVCIVRSKLPHKLADVDIIIPIYVIDEILRIGYEPQKLFYNDNKLGLHYTNNSWMTGQISELKWPQLDKYFEAIPKKLPPVPEGMLDAITQLKQFAATPATALIKLDPEGMHVNGPDRDAHVENIKFETTCGYGAAYLTTVLSAATQLDVSPYADNKPAMFRGDNIEGLLNGRRL